MKENVSRRRFVQTGLAAGGAVALAGCTAGDDQPPKEVDSEADTEADDEDGGLPAVPVVEDPPSAVYVPTHIESMRHLDPVEAGDYELLPMVTYPHRFWNVTGDEVEPADPEGSDAHLMIAVRDPETGMILPADTGLEIAVGRNGEPTESHVPWPMVSQEMGFHIGDNISLGDDGTYEVDVTVGSLGVDLTGKFEGRFDEPATGTFTFEFDQAFREEVVGGIAYLDEEHWGQRGALEPTIHHHHHGEHGDHGGHDDHEVGGHDDHDDEMHDGHDNHDDEMDAPKFGTHERDPAITELPPADALPGQLLGTPKTGDAVIVTTLLDAESRFVDDEADQYLAVSPRTPYNRGMLPLMTIDVAVHRDGEDEPVVDTQLTDTLDHELGYHYALRTDALEVGDTIELSFPAPPQVSRHAGYETAFLNIDSVEVSVD